MKTYTSYFGTASITGDIERTINNTLPENFSWGIELINDSIRYLVTRYYFNERSYTVPTQATVQFYNLPPQVKKIINLTVFVGGTLWQPQECPSRQMWDNLNVVPINQDYPAYFFIYNGQVGIYPAPSSSSNTITMNYKTRISDLANPDIALTGIAVTTNTTTITATSANLASWMPGQWIRINPVSTGISTANGDNQWYQIDSVTNSTTLVLKNKYTGATVVAGTGTVGEVSILPEDYQDLPLYRMGMIYYTTRFPDPVRAKLYTDLWSSGLAALDAEFGSKTTSIILSDSDNNIQNPNLFVRNIN